MPAITQIKLRRDSAADWTSTNPTLSDGEPGYVTDTGALKIGDGSTAFDSLTALGGLAAAVTTRSGSSQNIYDMADTWNDGGTTFAAIKMDVTDTASNADSLLMDLQVGSSSKFYVGKTGRANVFDLNCWDGDLTVYVTGTSVARFGPAQTSFSLGVGLSPSGSPAAPDVFLKRDDANELALRNSTAAQNFRVYNTYTDASNYERGVVAWDTNSLVVGTEAAGTGTARGMIFRQNAKDKIEITTAALTIKQASTVYIDSTTYFQSTTAAGSRVSAGNGFNVGSAYQYLFSSTTGANGAADAGLTRDSAGVVRVSDGSTGRGDLMAADFDSDGGVVTLSNLPTSDPTVANQLWNNSGVLTVSAG